MLDNKTKRQIDSARDILVGKVPDPKAQIDQITTAMIYKFMDDMDKEAQELGGNARFFADDLAEYSWTKLMDIKLSGDDRINLYREGIEKLKTAPNIPELFRSIFKNYYLPFYDQRTLSLFLKEINEFNYDNSENLGNAFEYLLSILGSQGDAGQFRTPRHIIDFIVEAIDPKKNETILDPACGTAGFLISAYKHILKTNSSNFKPEEEKAEDKIVQGETATETVIGEKHTYRGDLLTPDDRTKLTNNITGYDIDSNMVKLALVNLYLHGFPDPKIFEYDTLSSDKRWDEQFDVILANPPFMTPKGGISPHKRFSIQANRAEVLFVDYIAEHLSIKGRAGIIVPEGIIFQSAGAYKNLRKNLIENWGLYAVVSLPSGVFQPYSGVKTSILLMDREFAKRSKEILFLKVENDGFDLGAQRRKIDKNDLPRALEVLEKFKEKQFFSYGDFKNYRDIAFSVPKNKICENGDYNLTGERYKVDLSESLKANFETITKALEPHQKIFNEIAEHHQKQAEQIQKNIQPVIDQFQKQQEFINEAFSSLQEPIKQMQKAFEGYDFSKLQELAQLAKEELTKNQWPMVELGEVCDIQRGTSITKKNLTDGKIPVIAGGQQPAYYHNQSNRTGKTITVSASGAYAGFVNFFQIPIFASDCSTIQSLDENKTLTDFVFHLLKAKQQEIYKLQSGMGQPHVYAKDLKKIKIPLPPLEVQEQIVLEIEQYQKVIDGAKQVVENWKPSFRIDPSWEMVELGEVFQIESGGTPSSKNPEYWEGDIKWATLVDIPDNVSIISETKRTITDEGLKKSSAKLLPKGTVLVSSRATIGRIAIIDCEIATNQGFKNIIIDDKNNSLFVAYMLSNQVEKMNLLASGGTFKEISKSAISTIQIPLPPLEVQEHIVAEIEAEQKVVNANKELMEKMEKKVEAKIGEVWGDEIGNEEF